MRDYYNSDELMHYGRKGMKWGQNIFGKVKSGAGKAKAKRDAKKKDDTERKTSRSIGKKHARDMTADEIKKEIDRLTLEKNYKTLLNETRPETKEKGKKFVMNILEKAGENIGTQVATYALGFAVNKTAKELFKIDDNIVNPKKGQKDK